jgi:hypothetical protein
MVRRGSAVRVRQRSSPLRFIAGADAIDTAEQQIATLQQQIDTFRQLSSSLAIDEAAARS